MGNNDDYMERAIFIYLFFLAMLCSLKFPAMKAVGPNHWTAREFLTVLLEA